MRAVLFACCFGALIAAVVSQSSSASAPTKPTYQYVDPWFNAPDNLNTNTVAAVAASGQPYPGSNIGSGSGLANNPSYPTGGYTPVNGGATTVSAGAAAASAAGSGSTGAGSASAAAGVIVAIPGGGPATTPGIAMDPLSGYDPFGRPIVYWNGDCSSQKCQNGGTCYNAPTDPYVNPYDPSKDPKNKPPKDPSYPDPSYDPKNNYGYNPYDPYAALTTGVTGVQDLSNARDTDAALTAALAGQQVPVSASPTITTNRFIPNQGITPQAVGGSTGSGTTASGSGSGTVSSSSLRAYCRCPSGFSGTYCDVRTCSDPTINCAAVAPVALMVPPNTVTEFGDNTSPTSAGTGAAIATDSCSTSAIAVSDATSAGTQPCAVSSTITRTFTAQDGCNNFASGTQIVNVVDTTPPKITVTFDPLPPIAVTADQITLTPMQVQRLLLVLLKLGKVSKDALLLGVVGGPFNLLGGSGLLGLNANSEIGTLLGLIGASPSSSLADIFGDDTAKLMTDVGFNMTTATNLLQSALTSSSATIQAGGSGSAFDPISGVANALNNAGLPVRAVQVPVQQNDHFASWLTSDIALPVGVQVCERPSTRVFRVNCTVYDAGTSAKYLKAAARLHVTYITNRRKVGVQIEDPFKKNMKDMEKDMFDKFGKMKMPDMSHLFDEIKMKKMNVKLKPLSVDGSAASSSSPGSTSSTATVTPLSKFEQIVSDAMKKMPYDPFDSYDSYGDNKTNKKKNDNYNNDNYNKKDDNYNKKDDNYNKKDDKYKKEDPKEKKKKENDPPVTTTVIAGQCATKDDYVDLHCGDYVSITLDAEDACLADNFDDDDHAFMDKHTFDINDFKQFGEDKRFQQQQWLTSSKNGKMDIVTVRGTAVEFEAVAEDGCGNVGYGVSDPARDCEAFVAGVCCPPVTNAVSAFVRDQVLQADGNNMNMKMPTLQLADALKQALKLPL